MFRKLESSAVFRWKGGRGQKVYCWDTLVKLASVVLPLLPEDGNIIQFPNIVIL